MKILLKQDVTNLGYAGEVMDVANGFGRNYLIPQGLAVIASPGVLKEADVWRQRAAVRITEIRQEHEALSADIINTKLVFTARAGETGKLYGSITTADIAERINEQLGTDIDRRIISSEPLRQLGDHRVTIKLSRDFHPQVTVFIHPLEIQEDEVDEELEIEAGAEMESSEEIESVEEASVDGTPEEIQAADDSVQEDEDFPQDDEIESSEVEQGTELETASEDEEAAFDEDLDETS